MKTARDGQLTLSASDLVNFVECRHLTWLQHAVIRGDVERDELPERGDDAKLVSRKGDEHETEVIARLLGELPDPGDAHAFRQIQNDDNHWQWRDLHRQTVEAMTEGVHCIYQPVLYDGRWLGVLDLLRRVDDVPAPALGTSWSYEVTDIKLARSAKVTQLLQLCLYSEMLAQVQGVAPARAYLWLGDHSVRSYTMAEFSSAFRSTRARFEAAIDGYGSDDEPYPEPVPHCDLCAWSPRCLQRRRDDDHLSLVADIRGAQVRKLAAGGVDTLTKLAELDDDYEVERLSVTTLSTLRSQAGLQHRARVDGGRHIELREPTTPGVGFAALPEPSPGDVFFDLEGDPYLVGAGTGTGTGGLEYLWGAVTIDAVTAAPGAVSEPPPPTREADGETEHQQYLTGAPAGAGDTPEFTAWWAHDAREEQAAFEAFIDWLLARLQLYPDLHVYHYAPYEITAIKRMTTRYGTREAEVDQLLRDGVFVDLYRIVKQSLRTSQESYSIKQIEAFYRPARAGDVTTAGSSIVEYEAWLDDGDDHRLRSIAHYNRDDCVSTWQLQQWLLERKRESADLHGEWPPKPVDDSKEEHQLALKASEERAEVAGLSGDLLLAAQTQSPHDAEVSRLLAHLIMFHVREDKQFWWAFFDRGERSIEELVDDDECIGGLEPDGEPYVEKRSKVYPMRFPPQVTRMKLTSQIKDVVTRKGVGTLFELDVPAGRLSLKAGDAVAARGVPQALMPARPIGRDNHKARLRELAEVWRSDGLPRGRWQLALDMLARSTPSVSGVVPGTALVDAGEAGESAERLQARVLERTIELLRNLQRSWLLIQGPPGTGKTYTAARVIVDLLRSGKRVGVTGPSHEAICNLVRGIDEACVEAKVSYRGLYKHPTGNPEMLTSIFTESTGSADEPGRRIAEGDVDLVAGTTWVFARDEMAGAFSHLVVDEAGQVSLADACAVSHAADNLVLVGDPQQLPNVVQGAHPDGIGVSVLEHLLGEHGAVPPEQGVFLPVTRRMHPDVCDFVSRNVYEGALQAHPCTEVQKITGWGAGLFSAPVDHDGCSNESPAEAQRIFELVEQLVGSTYTDHKGNDRELTRNDILVVAPYNNQVAVLRELMPHDTGLRIGTVDKFQGQEAPVVIYSMTTSSRDDAPRNLEFLFSRNRCNVAISRAQCLAIHVASPSLLQSRVRSIEELALLNVICDFVDHAATIPELAPA